MAVMMMVEEGNIFFQCEDCEQSFFDNNEVLDGHEGCNEVI